MRKIYLTVLSALFVVFTLNAQVNYRFSAKSGTYTDLTGGIVTTVVADRAGVDAHDDGYINDLPIGFNFVYNGATYTTISANTNGFASFGSFTPITDPAVNDYNTADLSAGPFSATSKRPVLAPLWDDHDLFGDNSISYKTEGIAPNRVFTLQWDSVYWSLQVVGPNPTLAFQLKLYEGTNIIQFQYQPLAGPVTAPEAEIGISGIAEGTFLSLNNTTISPTGSYTQDFFPSVNAKPEAGQIYEFVPTMTFYSKATGDIGNLATWGTNTDGTGTQPSSFSAIDQQFILTNQTGTVSLGPGTMDLGGQLIITAGINLVTNDKLIIKSFADHTGQIGPIPATSSISGNVTVERFITSLNNRAYRFLTPSVDAPALPEGSIFNNWQAGGNYTPGVGTHVTGSTSGANGFDATLTGQPSLYLYDQVSPTQKYDPIANTDQTRLVGTNGYLLYVRGDRNPAHLTSPTSSSDVTLRATGTLYAGDVNFTGLQSDGRFSVVTNPFVSPLNWSTLYNDAATPGNSANFENSYVYVDPNIGSRGGYVTITQAGIQSVFGAKGTVEIQTGQAFFVKAKAGVTTPTLTVKESHKSGVPATPDVYRSSGIAPTQFAVSLFYNDATRGRRIADGVVALFQDGLSALVDGEDAEKLPNFDESISFARANKMLSIESRPLITKTDTLFLAVDRLKAQPYEWQFNPGSFGNDNLKASLKDKFLGKVTPIDLNNPTVVKFDVTSDPASSSADRFAVVFATGKALPIEMTGVKAYQKAAGIQVEWNTSLEINMDRYEVEKSVNGQQFDKIGSVLAKGNSAVTNSYNWFDATPVAGANYYRIRSIGKDGNVVYSAIIKVTLDNGSQIVSVFPNPVQGGIVNLQLNNLAKGKYNVSVLNGLGQQIYAKFINHTGGAASYKLPLGKGITHGIYQLRLTGEGQAINQSILVQNK